jgi:chromosome partitioning protein
MSVLMFINIKGGVAKTTNAVAVSQFLAEAGHRVLLIDADHQCAAGEILLGASRLERYDLRRSTLHDLFSEMVKDEFDVETIGNYVVPVASAHMPADSYDLSVMPSSLRMDDYQRNYHKERQEFHSNDEFRKERDARLRAFKNWLRTNYDYTIIDCPPSLPLQVQMLVKVADAYIVPCIPDKLSVRGAFYLVERLRRKNYKIPGLGTLWSLYRVQNEIHREMVSLASRRQDLFGVIPQPFDTIIPNATAIVQALESPSGSLSARYTSEFAKLYRQLVGEIVERCQKCHTTSGSRKQQRTSCTVS